MVYLYFKKQINMSHCKDTGIKYIEVSRGGAIMMNYFTPYNDKPTNVFLENTKNRKNGITEIILKEYIPGLLENRQTFIPSKIIFSNVIINSVIYKEEFNRVTYKTSYYLKLDCILFKDEYSEGLHFIHEIDKKYSFSFENMNKFIGFINNHVKSVENFENLDYNKLLQDVWRYYQLSVDVQDLINNLRFKFTEVSKRNIGRDDSSWRQAHISNISSNSYFRKLLCESLNRSSIHDDEIIYSYNRERGWGPASYGTWEIDDPEAHHIILIKISYYFGKNFDSTEYYLSYFLK